MAVEVARPVERSRIAAFGVATLLAICLLVASPRPAAAQVDPDEGLDVSVNYVYAAQLGFGGYRVGGLSVNVFSLPLQYVLHDVLFDWRLRIHFPIQYGDYDFKGTFVFDDEAFGLRASQHTLSAEPKLKLEIPVLDWWTVSMIGAWGFGGTFDTRVYVRDQGGPWQRFRELEDDVWYYTYQVGVSSLMQTQVDRWTLGLGNAFIYAGTADFTSDPDAEAYGALETGVEARHPLGFKVWDYEPDASLFFIWYYFTPSLEFTRVQQASLRVDNVCEVGISIGADPSTPFQLPVLGNPRIGISYRVGNDLDAIRLNFGFPF